MEVEKRIEIVGEARKWTGSFQQYKKHGDVIDRWVNGADVESNNPLSSNWIYEEMPMFFVLKEYREKQQPIAA